MKTELLVPNRRVVQFGVPGKAGISELAKEPSLFSMNMEHAKVKAGPIVQGILAAVEAEFEDDIRRAYHAGLSEVIDVRVQRLMPGMFPSIPGWHCDAVPRPNYFAQPDFALLNPHSFHLTCIVDTEGKGGIGNTLFLNESIEFNFDESKPVWKQLHDQIELAPRHVYSVPSGAIVKFSSRDPHKAVECIKRGWRLFFRLSMYHNPPVVNGVPSQQQVYILSEANGW